MRKVRKLAIAAIAVLLIALQTFCVSAAYKKAYECTKDELYNEAWYYFELRNINYSESEMPEPIALYASMSRYYLGVFLDDYTPENRDVTVSNVANLFYEYMKEKTADVDTLDVDDNGQLYELLTDGTKLIWTYDESSDKFIRYNDNGEIAESYDRYHPERETGSSNTDSSDTQSSESENSHNQAVANSKSDVDGNEVEAIAETQPTTAGAEATADDNGMSTGQIVVLSIIGGLIVIGGGTVGVMAVKKKKK